jgi:hypothetical protein
VHDDFLDERAVPGGVLDRGDVDAALAVAGGQSVGQAGLARSMGPSMASTTQSRSIGFSQQRGKDRVRP